MPIMLRLPVSPDEARVRELNAVCSTARFDFLAGAGALSANAELGSSPRADWVSSLDSVRRQQIGTDLPHGWLPADFLLAVRGIHRILVTCDDDNTGSARVIEANGGVLEVLRLKPGDCIPTHRYWISA